MNVKIMRSDSGIVMFIIHYHATLKKSRMLFRYSVSSLGRFAVAQLELPQFPKFESANTRDDGAQ